MWFERSAGSEGMRFVLIALYCSAHPPLSVGYLGGVTTTVPTWLISCIACPVVLCFQLNPVVTLMHPLAETALRVLFSPWTWVVVVAILAALYFLSRPIAKEYKNSVKRKSAQRSAPDDTLASPQDRHAHGLHHRDCSCPTLTDRAKSLVQEDMARYNRRISRDLS